MNRLSIWPVAAMLILGCTHDAPFASPASDVGPSGTGADVRLTYNSDQDYWPAWTEDGAGILYAFANPGGGAISRHRCIGLLPARGGTRIWELCDNRFVRKDTVSSYIAYALGSDGRLLYAEAVAGTFAALVPSRVSLYLADSATPLIRTELLTLPVTPGSAVTWMSDITWTGPSSFLALGQQFGLGAHCGPPSCTAPSDTTFASAGIVLSGTIAGGRATLAAIAGTDSATGYSLAENGASIAFIRRDNPNLYKVPVSGGAAVAVASVSTNQLLGVSCKGNICIVATDPITLFFGGDLNRGQRFPAFSAGPRDLRSVMLTSGVVQVLRDFGSTQNVPLVATPRISPVSGDVVAQIGGTVWGHLQAFSSLSNGDLHLFPALGQ